MNHRLVRNQIEVRKIVLEGFFDKWVKYPDCVENPLTWIFSSLVSDIDYLHYLNTTIELESWGEEV